METPKRETAKHCQQEQNAHGKGRKGSNIYLEHVTNIECSAIKLNNRKTNLEHVWEKTTCFFPDPSINKFSLVGLLFFLKFEAKN